MGLKAQDLPHKYLYVSKQTGQISTFNGNDGKTTDKYEQGSVQINVQGPISYSVIPNDLSIGPNQTKNWQGKVQPKIADCPAPGSSAHAKLIANYNVTYSRPQGGDNNGIVVQSSYNCATEADGNDHENSGCAVHGKLGGMHDIVNKIGSVEQPFEVFSINCVIPAVFNCVYIFLIKKERSWDC